MDDERKLQLTKSRLIALKNFKDLKDLAASKIARNLTLYLKQEDVWPHLGKISALMCDKVLLELLKLKREKGQLVADEEFRLMIEGFNLLINSYTKKIDLDGMLSFCKPEMREEIMEQIIGIAAVEAPQLQALSYGKEKIQHGQGLSARPQLIEAICMLENLNELTLLQHDFQYSDAMRICKRLHNLTHFHVRSIDLSEADYEDEEEFKECFSRLRVWRYEPKASTHFQCEQLRFACISRLPSIQVVQHFFELLPENFIKTMPGTSALRYFCSFPTSLPVHLAFPCVSHLRVQWDPTRTYDDLDLEPLLQFSHVQVLQLTFLPSRAVLDRFLSSYGKALRALRIHGSLVSLHDIHRACPKLEKLKLLDVYTSDEDPMPEAAVLVFPELKKLSWTLPSSQGNVKLSRLLLSPKLAKVSLKGCTRGTLNLGDARQVATKICERQILGQLSALKVGFFESENVDETAREHFAALSNLCKSVCAFLPNFATLDVSVNLRPDATTALEDPAFPLSEIPSAREIILLGERDLLDFMLALSKSF